MNTSQLLDACLAVAGQAGERIVEIYRSADDIQIQRKDDDSPLTRADLAAHQVIVAGLRALTPEWPILSEEGATRPYAERASWSRYWLVDPLDGTREFIKRNDEFTVNIALIENHRPVLGVVHVPVTDEAYLGGPDGAWRVRDGRREAIACRPLPDEGLTLAGSRSHAGERLRAYCERLKADFGRVDLEPVGSSLKLCMVASGAADLYPRLGKTCEWDTAAGQCVVEAAGGQVTDTQMRPLRYNAKESLLNPEFFVFGRSDVDWSVYLPSPHD